MEDEIHRLIAFGIDLLFDILLEQLWMKFNVAELGDIVNIPEISRNRRSTGLLG